MAEAREDPLTFEDGARAVELARQAIRSFVLNGQREHPGSMIDAFYERTGAIVRIESTFGRGGLRGCAGEHDGADQLGHAIVDAAIEAASADSCGSEVGPAELQNLVVSVCIVRGLVPSEDPEADIEIGRHGVVLTHDGEMTWLYPTVPLENGWTAREYLERTCRKAGLAPDAWQDDDVTVELFEGAVFREREPEGSIEAL
ncbi:MAG: TIGR00296 family protein [Halobacteriales archaeon]|nr:TIGR00296 family protein [Halobacteriales archaeon]